MSLESILTKYPKEEAKLLEILLEYQEQKPDHSISEPEVAMIAHYLDITESKVTSVISFYTLLSLSPRGKHIIQVCHNVPCFVNDSPGILKTIEQILGIHLGETTQNRLFTLEGTSCLGCCDVSPAIRIDGKVYGNLTPEKVKTIISEYRGR